MSFFIYFRIGSDKKRKWKWKWNKKIEVETRRQDAIIRRKQFYDVVRCIVMVTIKLKYRITALDLIGKTFFTALY